MRGGKAICFGSVIVQSLLFCLFADAQERSAKWISRQVPEVRVRNDGVSHLDELVTGDAKHLEHVVADYDPALKFYFTPTPPLPGTEPSLVYPSGWNISGQKLTVSRGGFTSAWITQVEGWDPDGDGYPRLPGYGEWIDAAGFKGANASPLNPGCDLIYPASSSFPCQKACLDGINAGLPCTSDSYCPSSSCDDPCPSILGEPGTQCIGTPGYCAWGWQNACGSVCEWVGYVDCHPDCDPPRRADWVLAANPLADQFFGVNIFSEYGPIFSASTCGFGCKNGVVDTHIRYYTGTLLLPVPACARGTYTIGFDQNLTYVPQEGDPGLILSVAAFVTGVLEIPIGSCCTDFTTPSSATCTDGMTLDQCNALPSANLHIFRPDADCTTPCEVECATAADCDDHKLCTEDSCTSDGQCVNTQSDAICDDGVNCTTDVCVAANDSCIHTTVDAACDDGLFCNGVEFCTSTGCQPGDPPCGFGETCDETNDSCGLTPIPTVSQWGLCLLALVFLIGAKVGLRRMAGS